MTDNPLARALAALAFALGVHASAQTKAIDGIVAIVNDDVVLASEVVERFDAVMQQLNADGAPDIERDVILDQILERLVLESLQLQEAEGRGVVLDDETLTRAVRDYATQNRMDIDQFIAALAEEGISYRAFREQVRRQLTLDRVQREVVNRRVYITEQDIDQLLASPFFAEQISDEYRVGHILLAVHQNASADEVEALAAKADGLVAELRDGADFAALAVEHSSASTALEGGDLGWRKASRLPSLFAEQVLELTAGEVLEPLRNSSASTSSNCSTNAARRSRSTTRRCAPHPAPTLRHPHRRRDPRRHRSTARAHRRRRPTSQSWPWNIRRTPAALWPAATWAGARPISSYASSKRPWAGTDVDALSPPFRSEFGWHILEVQGRRQQDASDEARRDYAVRVLHAQRFEERMEEWLTEIRDEAFVEKRLAEGDDEAAAEDAES